MNDIITPISLGFDELLLYRDYWNRAADASLLDGVQCAWTFHLRRNGQSIAPPDMADAYREMADDGTREWDAMEWSEALIGEALTSPQTTS